MKKIFTLICMVLCAVGVKAQEVWDASTVTFDESTKIIQSSADGSLVYKIVENNNENFFTVPQTTKVYPEGTWQEGGSAVLPSDGTIISMKNYEITVKTANVTMHAVSTPNSDASEKEAWQRAGGGNQALDTDDCPIKFTYYIKPKNGNPSVSYKEYHEETSNGVSFRVSEQLWSPELGVMPNKGLYYEFTTAAAGELLLGIIVWRPGNNVYVFEKSSMTQFPTSSLSIDGYVNNNTVVWGGHEKAFSTVNMTENHDYQMEGIPGKQILGFMKLNVEAGKTYVLLSSNAQPGIYGFQFTAGEAGINDIKTDVDKNAPSYNLAGQRVDENYHGVVIKNGKKYMNK